MTKSWHFIFAIHKQDNQALIDNLYSVFSVTISISSIISVIWHDVGYNSVYNLKPPHIPGEVFTKIHADCFTRLEKLEFCEFESSASVWSGS